MFLKMNLSQAPLGKDIRILGYQSEWNEKFQQRLMELGFGCGHIVTCIRKTPMNGPQVFRSADTLYSLGSDVTEFIFVEVVNES